MYACNCWCGCVAMSPTFATCDGCIWGIHAVPVEILPGEWPTDWPTGEENECDDCYRTDGTHDPEVEH